MTDLTPNLTQVATTGRKIILSARQRVSKGDFPPQTPFDTPHSLRSQGYSGCVLSCILSLSKPRLELVERGLSKGCLRRKGSNLGWRFRDFSLLSSFKMAWLRKSSGKEKLTVTWGNNV